MSANLKAVDEPTGLSAKGIEFLKARGLNPELCDQLGLTSGPGRGGAEWIIIPYERNGERVNRKFRRIDEKAFVQDKGGEQIFWRYDCLADAGLADQPLVITEGEFDAIAAIQAGFWRAVSIPGGAPAEPMQGEARASGKYAFLEMARAKLEKIKRIVIAADADGPGAALLSDLTALLGPARCQFVVYPDGCKDLNDVMRLYGEAGVRAAIMEAKWVRVAGVHKLFDLPPLPPIELWRPDVHEPIDNLIPICPGQVSVWTGIPGHGKSSLLNAIAWSLAKRDGLRVAHGSFEAQPQREYQNAAIAYFTKAPAASATPEQVDRMRRWLNDRITFLVADGFTGGEGEEEFFDADLAWFFDAAKTAVVRDACRLVILDPWSQIEHARSNNEPETTYVQRSIRRARSFARSFDVHVAIVAHPTKMRRLEDGAYAMPEGYEISGCYSDDTEVLTKRGWLHHRDVTTEDDVACFDMENEKTLYAKPERIIKKHYSGEMHRFCGYGYDLLVTPEHRMVVKPMWPNPARKWPKGVWQFCEAQEMPSAPFTLPLAAPMDHPPQSEDAVPVEWAAIAGWYVAEGCRQSAGICIAQAEGEKSDEIEDLLKAAGITYKINKSGPGGKGGTKPMNAFYIGYRFNKGNAPLISWIKENCGEQGSANKRIPKDIQCGSVVLKRAFLHAYLDGDGSPARPGAFRATTTSPLLRDQLQQLCLELGLPFCWREDMRAGENHSRKWSFGIGRPDRTAVAIRTSRNLTMEKYEGDVWCLTVPTGAYITRRNGRATICGNSAHWFNGVDLGVTTHRAPPMIEDPESEGDFIPDPHSTRVLIRVWKKKNHSIMGKPGDVFASFDSETGRYSPAEHWEERSYPRRGGEPIVRDVDDD